jgi:hypothetical protein
MRGSARFSVLAWQAPKITDGIRYLRSIVHVVVLVHLLVDVSVVAAGSATDTTDGAGAFVRTVDLNVVFFDLKRDGKQSLIFAHLIFLFFYIFG